MGRGQECGCKLLYVVASMEDELASLRLELDAVGKSHGVRFPVEFHLLGVGPKRAGAAMAAALANGKRRPQGVLLLGVAGAVVAGHGDRRANAGRNLRP